MAQRTMIEPAYVEQLIVALRKALRGAEVSAERVRGDRYRFIVIWKSFDRQGHPERQQRVWDVAERALKADDLLKISMILTLGAEDMREIVA